MSNVVIVIHGWWTAAPAGGHLTLWAEDATAPPEVPRRPGRRPRVQTHPFALAADELAKILALETSADPPAAGEIPLPGTARGPACSPELLAARAALGSDAVAVAEGPPTTWRVPTLRIDPDTALQLLLSARRGETGTPPQLEESAVASFGADLRLLSGLAAFALDLAGRGRVLPAVVAGDDGEAFALWRPVVTGADAGWLRAAVAAAPGVLAGESAAADPSQLAAATDALVDAAVRSLMGRAPRRRARTSWRDSLRGTDRGFDAAPGEAAALAGALVDWQRDVTSTGAVRAYFRLVEPTPSEDGTPERGWRLDFGLQASDEPSLVVDAARVWRAGASLRSLARHVADPQETLLAELGRAVRLYPALAPALRTARPASLDLDTAGAHALLTETAPLLLAAGFGVLLPGWWTQGPAQLGAKLRVSTPGQPGMVAAAAGIGQEGIATFEWQLAVGAETLTDREIADLVEAQQPLVRVRGQWLQVDPDRLRQAWSYLSRRSRRTGRMSVADVFRALAGDEPGPAGLPVTGVDADGWLGELLSGDNDQRLTPMTAPEGFVGSLRPYQERGLAWLSFLESAGLGGVLADDMGLGKTVQLLALIQQGISGAAGSHAPGVPDVAGRQLAARSGEIHPPAARPRPSRRRTGPREDLRTSRRECRSGRHDVLAAGP